MLIRLRPGMAQMKLRHLHQLSGDFHEGVSDVIGS